MKHKTSEKLYQYWNHVRGERSAPNRFEIEPSKIAGILPTTFILERQSAEVYRFRLAGTRMCEIFGKELRGTDFLEGWATDDRPLMTRNLSILTNQAATALIRFQATARDEQAIEFELLLLPLCHTKKKIDRILGCCSPLDSPGWLGDKPLLSKRLMANELVWPSLNPQTSTPDMPVDSPVDASNGNARIVRFAQRQFVVHEGGLSRNSGKEI
ncbi:MAG: PAS domain-containing protein [Hyphomicrobium sp.]|nr:PAS domain-containing protein [Hyphomicrobium sp.]